MDTSKRKEKPPMTLNVVLSLYVSIPQGKKTNQDSSLDNNMRKQRKLFILRGFFRHVSERSMLTWQFLLYLKVNFKARFQVIFLARSIRRKDIYQKYVLFVTDIRNGLKMESKA